MPLADASAESETVTLGVAERDSVALTVAQPLLDCELVAAADRVGDADVQLLGVGAALPEVDGDAVGDADADALLLGLHDGTSASPVETHPA